MLCHYCGYAEKVPSHVPEVRERAHLLSRRGLASAWKRSCTAPSPQRGSRAWIATRSPASASTRPSCTDFREGNFDILVGTQMIAKGHDIPNVTLVGVVSADVGLGHAGFPRGRAHLSAADAGGGPRRTRQHLPGIVLVQTINPDHYAVRFAAAQDYQRLLREGTAISGA